MMEKVMAWLMCGGLSLACASVFLLLGLLGLLIWKIGKGLKWN